MTSPPSPAAPEAPPPRELVVDAKPAPGDSSDGGGTAMAPVALPVLAAGALAKFVSPMAGLAALGIAVGMLFILRKPSEGRFVLRVDGESVEVTRERPRSAPTTIVLGDLLDVTLDRETTPSGGRGGGTKERVRLALERRAPASPIFVPDEAVTSLEAQEWCGKVRVFLRKHGWVPANERAV